MQTRGPVRKDILDAIDMKTVTEDFEECTTTSEQWGDCFRNKRPEVDLNRSKVDVYFVLLDKLGVTMSSDLKKYGTNGIRCYKHCRSTALICRTAHHESGHSQVG